MGEAKRKQAAARDVTERLTKILAEDGALIQGGWEAAEAVLFKDKEVLHRNPEIVELAKQAWFGSAQHLWQSMMSILDEDCEVITEADMMKCALIQHELDEWAKEATLRFAPTEGSS